MSNELYIKTLETRNDELMDRISSIETEIKKLKRRKGTYPVFKLIRRKVKRSSWVIDCEYLTNCDCVESIIPVISYSLNHPISIDFPGELIGFQYWRQSINYRWALSGMSHFIDVNLKNVRNIDINPKNGDVKYQKY